MSPSSQRAWIEILFFAGSILCRGASPSSQRAWIEMRQGLPQLRRVQQVALLAEGVDRNRIFIKS